MLQTFVYVKKHDVNEVIPFGAPITANDQKEPEYSPIRAWVDKWRFIHPKTYYDVLRKNKKFFM